MSELDDALRRHRAALARRERESRRSMRVAYRDAVRGLSRDLQAAQRRITELRALGQPVPTWRLLQEAQIRQLLAQAEMQFARFGDHVRFEVIASQREAIRQAQTDAVRLIEAGFGPAPTPFATLPIALLPTRAMSELIGALQYGSPLNTLLREMGPKAAATVERELIAGMAAGKNSRVIARNIRDALGGNLTRANLIARTETHRAYRAATGQMFRENRHLLRGWTWSAALDRRTCPVCWAMHGRVFTVDDEMQSHPACRCNKRPLVKTWADIGYPGIDTPNARALPERGPDIFRRLPAADQAAILGPAAYQAYTAEAIDLTDLVGITRSSVWGTGRRRISLAKARERATQRRRQAA